MSGPYDHLPEVLAQIACATSEATASTLAERLGGTRIWVRAEPVPGDKLTDAVGLPAARAIARAIGAGPLDVPTAAAFHRAARAMEILRLLELGTPVNEVALQTGVSRATVYAVRAGKLANFSRQGHAG